MLGGIQGIRDMHGMSVAEASHIARKLWGGRGFATVDLGYTPEDIYDERGFRIPSGPVIAYVVGYKRKGKRGRTRITSWRGSSFQMAFDRALRRV